jgi:HPt (histidine-containing phosphotransfer) domain-containing protein
MSGDRQQCAEAGMDAFLPKPIRRPDLIATLEDIVARFHDGTPAPATATKRPLATPARDAEPPFDAAEMMERFEGSEDVLNEVFTLFRQDMPGRIAALHVAFARQDGMALQHAAHSIKGALATLAAHPARDVAADLEEMGEARSLAGVPEAMVRLDRELARLSLALHDFRPPAAAA